MRINVGIPVKFLSDEHLRAEEAEIAMVPGFYNKVWKGKSPIPKEFTLNKGHISFFMNKKSWTLNRYKQLHQECINRGFNIKDKSDRWNNCNIPDVKYIETGFERDIIKERIINKINNSSIKNFHYYREKISKKDLICLLNLTDLLQPPLL